MKRRGFFKTLLGAAAVAVGVPAAAKIAPPPVDPHTWMIPLIRQTMPPLLASDIVGVQPMSGPIGTEFQLTIDTTPLTEDERTLLRRHSKSR